MSHDTIDRRYPETQDTRNRRASTEGYRSDVGDQHVVVTILMHSLDVPANVGLPLAAIITIGTLEARLLAALVAQVSLQGALPDEDTRAVRARELLVRQHIVVRPQLLVHPREVGTCEHRSSNVRLTRSIKNARANVFVSGRSGFAGR